MGVLEWKAAMYDKYDAYIDEGKPIWSLDQPQLIGASVKMVAFNAVTGEIRQLTLTIEDIFLIIGTEAFSSAGSEIDQSARDAIVQLAKAQEDKPDETD